MKLSKAEKLREEIIRNSDLNITPTVVKIGNDEARLNIRDLEFTDEIKAQVYIHNIAMTELPHNFVGLIG